MEDASGLGDLENESIPRLFIHGQKNYATASLEVDKVDGCGWVKLHAKLVDR